MAWTLHIEGIQLFSTLEAKTKRTMRTKEKMGTKTGASTLPTERATKEWHISRHPAGHAIPEEA